MYSLLTLSITPGRWQLKTLILTTNIYQKSLETEILIAIYRQSGDKWQSKTIFLSIFDPHSLIVKNVFDCNLHGVSMLGSTFVANNLDS